MSEPIFIEFIIQAWYYDPERKDDIVHTVRQNFAKDFDSVTEGSDNGEKPVNKLEIKIALDYYGSYGTTQLSNLLLRAVWRGNGAYCPAKIILSHGKLRVNCNCLL